MEHKVMLLAHDGRTESFSLPHDKIHLYFQDSIAFCGAIHELSIVAVTHEIPKNKSFLNVFSLKFPENFDHVYGDILLVGDYDGQACHIDIDEASKYLQL